jgi:hypothetical protein
VEAKVLAVVVMVVVVMAAEVAVAVEEVGAVTMGRGR